MRSAILAFDLGTQCGYAWCAADALYTGSIDSSRVGLRKDNRHGAVFSHFTAEATRIIRIVGPQVVYYEDAAHSARRTSVAQSQCWFGFRACLLGVCHELDVPVHSITTPEWRKAAGIRQSDGKNAVIRWCNDRKILPANDNEADAVAILNAVLPQYGATLEQFKWRKLEPS